jgi:DNA-binding MarR family transcriptional regulator
MDQNEAWRETHMGRVLALALARFEARTLDLMAQNIEVPLALSNLAQRAQISAAHVHITRHLPMAGARMGELARRAGLTKQAMGALVSQCEAWDLVRREPDPQDARACRVAFTNTGLAWLRAHQDAVAQAELEFRDDLGAQIAAVVKIGLDTYASGHAS